MLTCRYVRKEKDIAEAQKEVIESECARYRQKSEHLEKQLKATEDLLKEERERIEVRTCAIYVTDTIKDSTYLQHELFI